MASVSMTEHAWPPEVLDFATKHSAASYLDPVQTMTLRLFPGRQVKATVQADYEISDESYITIWVNVSGLSVEELGAAERDWYAQLRQICSRAHESLFYLGADGS